MVYVLPTDAGLGRRCKAKAMAKAVAFLYDTVAEAAGAEVAAAVAAAEQEKATEAAAAATAAEKKKATEAEDRRRQHHDWQFGCGDWRMQAASQPSPWGDMEETAMVDNPADSVVHADASGLVSIIAPPGDGVPCTECHVQHRGTCSFHDRELKAWEDLGNEAALLPSPWNDM